MGPSAAQRRLRDSIVETHALRPNGSDARAIRLIIVEDRPTDAELMVLQLQGADFDPIVERVETREALVAALGSTPDLVLSDWSLPAFSGLEALATVRSRSADLPFILVSGTIGEEAAVDALRAGADDYILKDRMARLGPAVRRALDARRQRADQQRLEIESQRLSSAIEQAQEAVIITDTEPRILYVNPAFERITGFTRGEVMGQNPRIIQGGTHSSSFYQTLWAALGAGKPWAAEFINRKKDGSTFLMRANISPIVDQDGSIASYVSVGHDVTRERELEATTTRIARERALIAETLAGLPVHGTADEVAEAICRQVVTLSGLGAAALVQFDHEGFAAPLALVTEDGEPQPQHRLSTGRSKQLRGRASKGPWVESFSPGTAGPYRELHERLGTSALAEAPVRYAGALVGMLAAFASGAESAARLTEALPALLEFADLAGILVGHEMAGRTDAGRVRSRVRAVIDDGAFHPVYQPIVDLATHDIVGYEALTRFASGERPDLVFAEAWSVGLGPELEIATLRVAVETATALPPGRWLSVNMSPGLLAVHPDLSQVVNGGRAIVAEITEHETVADYDQLRIAIRRIGPDTRLAVDDAGAGVANFAHIIDLRADFVKIDIGLVRDINRDVGRQAMMVGMRHFARAAGCQLIAEGIETQAEADTVAALGAEFGQGYLLGRPAPIEHWVVDGADVGPGAASG